MDILNESSDIVSKIKKEAKFIRLNLKQKGDVFVANSSTKMTVKKDIRVQTLDFDETFKLEDYKQAMNVMKNALKDLYESEELITESMDAEKVLRDNKFKIKSVHGTKFGTEFIMAKQYEEEDIKKVLSKYTLKFDGKSIFVIS